MVTRFDVKYHNFNEVLDQIDCKILEIKNHYSEEFDNDTVKAYQ